MEPPESQNQSRPADTDAAASRSAWRADRELVARARAGSSEAVEILARRMLCIPRILDSIARRSGPPLDDELRTEAAQEVATRVWAGLDRYEGRASLETWIYRYCALTLLDLRRERQRRARRELPADAGEVERAVDPRPEGLRAQDAATLHAAVARLAPEEAAVVEAHCFDGLTFEQVGARLGCSPNTAKTRYYRAVERLRRWLRSGFGDDAGARGDVR
ncbi:MAG: sigma-70 family RNA polymerase sigma factor [Planctomycetes bacterium]|nr:sigma-70 family RNA polymerase sigma factor [Planctomycetota bacterium]